MGVRVKFSDFGAMESIHLSRNGTEVCTLQPPEAQFAP